MKQHDHCNQCYDIKCQVGSIQGGKETFCRVIECPSGCNTFLHECKVTEHHEHICGSHVIACTNSNYGCPHTFPRRKLISHLRHCPASVVTCKLEWNRELCDTQTSLSPAMSSQNVSDVLDVSLVAKDKRVLEASLKMPRSLRTSLQNTYTRNFPAVPFVQRSCDVPEEDSNDDSTDCLPFPRTQDSEADCKVHRNIPGYAASSQSVHCSLCKARGAYKGEGLATSISTALTRIKNDQLQEEKIQEAKSAALKQNGTKVELNLDLQQEMYNSFRAKPEKMLTFLCAQDFRRDQFSEHYLTAHMDIQTGLNGWFQERCPLATYGCTFTQHRFITDQHERAFFNPATNSFCLGSTVESEVEDRDDVSSQATFTNLPELVLLLLFTYLDSLSIKNLSLTSKVMRDKCCYLLNSKGIVVLNWKKLEGVWRPVEKIWSFSNAFQRPRAWLFAERMHMGEHLKQCPYNNNKQKSSEEALVSNQGVMMHLPLRLTRQSPEPLPE